MKYQTGEDFLNHLNKNMHMEDVVMHTANPSNTPEEKIGKYLERLEKSHNKAKEAEHKMNILKQLYYNKYVIKTLPESYINLQKKIAHEEGYGNIDITKEMKQEMLFQIQEEQKSSLNRWIEYFCSDDAMYPMWFKNYAFEGMIKLGKYDKKTGIFTKRTKTTVTPYIDLNREVLAQVYNVLSHQIGENKLTKEEEKMLENGESFKKLYTHFFKEIVDYEKSKETDGIWIKYNQGSDYHKLWESLQGKNTGWCTAGEKTAKMQLVGGDFYIYYTKDKNNEYKDPRIAIRMNGKSKIGEVRGIAKDQNLEPNMEKILDEKLNEFPDKEEYQKKVSDMKYLTMLEQKQEEGLEFSFDDLTFLYQINNKIDGFGWESDPRIMEIIQKRNQKKDLSFILKVPENEIAITRKDLSSTSNICIFFGNLSYKGQKIPKSFSHLKIIMGDADFPKLIDATNLSSLQFIKGNANFPKLISAKGLSSLKVIEGSAIFYHLKSATDLNSLQQIYGDGDFYVLTSAKGLNFLQSIGENACFYHLESAEDLISLENIGLDAFFPTLTAAKGLNSLKNIGGYADFSNLITSQGLTSLQRINQGAKFNRLTQADGLISLQYIGDYADFRSLKTAHGLSSLQTIISDINFNNLIDASDLTSLTDISNIIDSPYIDLKQIVENNQKKSTYHH